MFSSRSLSTRFLKAYLLSVGLSVLVLYSVLEYRHFQTLEQDLVRSVQKLVSSQNAAYAKLLWEFDIAGVETLLADYNQNLDFQSTAVYDAAGRLVAEAGPIDIPPDLPELRAETLLRYTSSTTDAIVGRMVITFRRDRIFDVMKERLQFDAFFLFVICIGLVGTTLLVTRNTVGKPLSRLRQSIDRMTKDNIPELVQWDSDDELGSVVKRYNEMLVQQQADRERLEEYQENLRRAHDELEADVAERTKELAQQKSILELTLENMDQGITMFDKDLNLMAYNRSYAVLRDFPEEFLDQRPSMFEMALHQAKKGYYPQLDGDPDAQSRDWVKQIVAIENLDVYEQETPDGSIHEIRSQPLADSGFVRVYTDITERKRLEERLRRSRDEAEANAEAKSEFVAVVSHEVRTPMNGVLGMARLLADTNLDEEQREGVDTIVTSGESLLRIVDDLLDLSKLEADRLDLELIPFIGTDIIDQSVAIMAPDAEVKGLSLESEIDPKMPAVVIGDPHRLRQVLLNLISNGVKFTTGGKVVVKTQVESANDNEVEINFAVSDTGKGIAPDVQERLFSVYSQGAVEVARKYGGTGLGLNICRRLVEVMGSRITLDSEVGRGSTFQFSLILPIDHVTDGAGLREQVSTPVRTPGTAMSSIPPLNVLQVEDNFTNQAIIEMFMTRRGHRVVNAGDGHEALAALEKEDFDLILMDRHMPQMNGIEATRRIREMKSPIKDVPIIGITAAASESEVKSCIDTGMDACITKPVNPGELTETIIALTQPKDPVYPSLPADRSVLIVDDVQINRLVAQRQLSQLGLTSETADGGSSALALLKTKDFGAVLIDINMPDMDGFTFTSNVRDWESGRERRTPIIAMTGFTSAEERQRFTNAGMDGYLAKPVVLAELAATLAACLNGAGERA